MPFHTRQGFVSMVAWALSFPKHFRRSSSSRRGTSQVTYVTMVPRGNETLRRMLYFLHPCERFLHFEAAAVSTAGAFILPGRYVISAGDVSPGFPRTDYTRVSERGNTKAFPKRFRRSSSSRRGTMVTYVTWDVLG